ncbi:response regulator [Leptolyngbya sp. FACHB-541]|uniref:response regulator n=1 Tax=Leptolyngbya sp. FACHB-541 TaxID=2692810 RepID=UPI001689D045|nr:response regulator [Leptolyngbya sp. FACHB-541]MBD2000352.1 response regulator [Leptolyngbya sp. FACHB-541]
MDLELPFASGPNCVANRPLILAVDDNEDNLLMLLHALDLFGFSSISTLKGQAALPLAQAYQPDLILMDIVLPDLSGLEIIHRLKQTVETAHIPIIAVTALARAEDRESILQTGCEDYIYKPYNLDELEVMLQQHLSRMRSVS